MWPAKEHNQSLVDELAKISTWKFYHRTFQTGDCGWAVSLWFPERRIELPGDHAVKLPKVRCRNVYCGCDVVMVWSMERGARPPETKVVWRPNITWKIYNGDVTEQGSDQVTIGRILTSMDCDQNNQIEIENDIRKKLYVNKLVFHSVVEVAQHIVNDLGVFYDVVSSSVVANHLIRE